METEREAAINETRYAAFMDEHPAIQRELRAVQLLNHYHQSQVNKILRLSGQLSDKLSAQAKGQLPFFGVDVGETQLVLHPAIPGDYDGGGGNIKKLFTVSKTVPDVDSSTNQQKKYAWPVNPRSPLYRDVLTLLPKTPLKIGVVRTGKDKTDTRYSLREIGPA